MWLALYVAAFFVLSVVTDRPDGLIKGLKSIVLSSDILITDYIELAGFGAACLNVGLVMLSTMVLMYINKMPIQSGNIVTIGLMSGFAFFGKNIFNMWFILLGTYLFCTLRKEPMSKYLLQSFWASSLGPLITGYTVRIQHGLNLYNGGFATGLMAMMLTPVLKAFGYEFNTVSIWCTQYNRSLSTALIMLGILLIVLGVAHDENAVTNYRNLLKRPGNPVDDFLLLDGIGAVAINTGVNIILATIVVLAIGGDINGPTIGGILTIAGFSVKGKHARNILPVMLGLILSGLMRGGGAVVTPAAQLALLFGTTLAPISGTYGFPAGIVAGFIHSCVVLYAGAGYSGVNLYNNGFAGGLVAIVMHSVLSEFFRPKEYSKPSDSMLPKPLHDEDVNIDDLYFHE